MHRNNKEHVGHAAQDMRQNRHHKKAETTSMELYLEKPDIINTVPCFIKQGIEAGHEDRTNHDILLIKVLLSQAGIAFVCSS